MIPTHLLRKAACRNALLTLPHLVLEETHPTVPTNNSTTIRQLNDRIERLEISLKEDTDEFKKDLKALKEELDVKTATERAVTSKPFKWLLGVVAAFLVGVVGFFYTQLLPDKIEMGISHSPALTKRLDGFDNHFGAIDGVLQQIRNEIADLRSDIKGLANPNFISAALKEAVSGDKSTLSQRLPDVKRLARQIISLKVPLPDRKYKEYSKPLLNHANTSKPPIKDQLWEALLELATAKSSTEAIVHPLSDEDIVNARAREGYIENVEVDLSQKENWENVIFKNCKIGISKPANDLVLTGVRFIECSFEMQPENGSMQELLKAVLENEGPQISKTVTRFTVLSPVYKGSPTPQVSNSNARH